MIALGQSKLFLVGFMGAGKTTLGRRLAQELGVTFVDTDEEIERRAGMSIAKIFQEKGESTFRELERKAVEAVCRGDAAIVSLGGGAFLDAQSRRAVSSFGTSIYLKAKPETLMQRLGDFDRPLFREVPAAKRKSFLESLLAKREESYAKCDVTIKTDEKTVDELISELRKLCKPSP